MSGRTITIVNSANVYALNFLKNLRGYDRIILGDIYNNRNSFLSTIHKLREEDKNVTVEHMNINSDLLLEQCIKPANTVVYFTHDYLSLVPSKNGQMEQTASICNAYNVDKLLTVNPIEFVNYFESDDPLTCPIEAENATHDKILKEFKKSVILRANMVFGTSSYLVRYLQQNWLCNHAPFDSDEYKHFRFNPIHHDDFTALLNNVLNDTSDGLLGKKLNIEGHDSLSFVDINNKIKLANYRGSSHTSTSNLWKKTYMAWQLFFHGNNHFNNMETMLHYFNHRNPNLKQYENLKDVLKYEYVHDFTDFYVPEKNKDNFKILDEELKHPVLFKYWKNSLD